MSRGSKIANRDNVYRLPVGAKMPSATVPGKADTGFKGVVRSFPTPVPPTLPAGDAKRVRVPGGAPSRKQRRWLVRGLDQAGGKLPLFDEHGQRISERTVKTCLERGWVEPWFANPVKPDWLVCRLTDRGRAALE